MKEINRNELAHAANVAEINRNELAHGVNMTEIKNNTPVKVHIIYCMVIIAMLAVMIVGAIATAKNYADAVGDRKSAYKQAKVEYDEAYERIVKEEKAWKKEMAKLQDDLNETTKELNEIYEKREADQKAEEKRWKSLSKAEQQAEKKCISYNQMVSYLRANNPDYAKLYVKYASYISQDVFNLDKAKLVEYTNLYKQKLAIEQEYMKKNPIK